MNRAVQPLSIRALLVLILLLASSLQAQRDQKTEAPDLTRGGTRPEGFTHDWNLGPTGLRGWIHSKKLTTTHARQILVTEVAEGSPAAGKLKIGDVILGAGESNFDGDPRILLGRAIGLAESKRGKGRLKLQVWRRGRRKSVTLELRVLGSYSDTAPYDCQKSERIFELGCRRLAKAMKEKPRQGHIITRALNALALLSSGDKKYLPVLRKQVEILREFNQESGVRTWSYAYVNIFLAEYLIATGDKRRVRNDLRRITRKIVDGQGEVGSWGHDFIRGEPPRLGGYGMMNAPGIPLTISLVLAREAGIQVPGLDEAIQKSRRLLRFYVGKGSIPYGDHRPWIEAHCDNGKNEMAAILFDMVNDVEATTYFSKMAVASHGAERDTGHTGNFFNMTWALPGVARSGPNATGAWLAEFGWSYDLARRFDFAFPYQGAPTEKPESYNGWDCSGAYLLAYAQARMKTVFCGSRPSCAPKLDEKTAVSLIDDGRGWSNADKHSFQESLSTKQLLKRLESWSPVVRERAAIELGRRKKAKVVPKLKDMLRAKTLEARYGACQALKFQKGRAEPAVKALIKTLSADDMWLRILAAEALAGIGKPASPAVPELLERLTRGNSQQDPRDMERRYLTFALFDRRQGLIGKSLEGVDQALLMNAVRHSLLNQDGRARGAVSSVYRNLSFEQLRPLMPAILEAIIDPAPSGIMFADQIRTAGLELLAKHHVEEGMDLLVDYARNQKKHASEHRLKDVLKMLESYGVHAKRMIPNLRALAEYFDGGEAFFPQHLSKQKAQWVRDSMKRIAASKKRPKLVWLDKPR